MLSSHCFARSPVPRSKRGVTRQPIPASCQWSFDISGQSLRTESPNTKVHFRFDFILRFNISSCAVYYGYGFQGARQTSKEGWQDRGWGKTLFVVVRGREAPPGCCDGLFAQKATEGETCLIVTFARFELMMTAQERQETRRSPPPPPPSTDSPFPPVPSLPEQEPVVSKHSLPASPEAQAAARAAVAAEGREGILCE